MVYENIVIILFGIFAFLLTGINGIRIDLKIAVSKKCPHTRKTNNKIVKNTRRE